MKGEFLLEIGTEEIPASFMNPAAAAAIDIMAKALESNRVDYSSIEAFATPRRLILRVVNLEDYQKSVDIEKSGPMKSAAFDADGNPTKAATGFAKSQGVDISELVVISTPKGEQMAVRKREEGKSAIHVLSDIIPNLMEKIPFPKTMRWMDLDVRFARPIHWIVALYNGQIVPITFGSISSGNFSYGHRFVHPGSFTVNGFADLKDKLGEQGIILDANERKQSIKEKIELLAKETDCTLFDDPNLLEEVTFLVESPYPIMGEFSADFLELPASILITCMKKHQRYFSLRGPEGRITNKFIAINNTPVKDTAVSIKGHQRVLKARLEDARFYYLEDRKTPLINSLEALKGVVFHSKLGTAYEKVERFTHLAIKLAEIYAKDRVNDIERASLLSKCDLETGIVYEFPELQGIIGSYYARKDGEPDDIAIAIREHYLPAFAGDSLPSGIIGSIVSIADRMDTIAGCFSVGLIPTGTADPYALRRNALAIIQIIVSLDKPLDLKWLIATAVDEIGDKRTLDRERTIEAILEFIQTRFLNFYTGKGYPLDVVEAAVRARFRDIVDAKNRVIALADWKTRPDIDSLMIGFKRVVNILKGIEPGHFTEDLLQDDAEKALYQAYKQVLERANPAIKKGDYEDALQIIAELKSPIDTFFDKVMVMVNDEDLKGNRLALLGKIAELFNEIADFSFIGSTAR